MDQIDPVDQQEADQKADDLLNKALETVSPGPNVALNNVSLTSEEEKQIKAMEPTNVKAPAPSVKPLSNVKTFDDPSFWDAFYNTLNHNMEAGRIPKFFAVSASKADKFLAIAKAKFQDFESKDIKTIDDLSFNIVSKDSKTQFTVYVVSSQFVLDPPGADGGQFF